MLGICVVDILRLYRNKDSYCLEWAVLKFTYHLAAHLVKVETRPTTLRIEGPTVEKLERIIDAHRNKHKPLTKE